MDHCWCILRHQPKWQQYVTMMNQRKKVSGRPIRNNASTPLDDNVEMVDERPLGKKGEIERERNRKSRECEDAEFNKALSRMQEDRTVCIVERREAFAKAENDRAHLIELEKNKLVVEKRKINIEIMKLDLVGMNAIQREYFQILQEELYEEMKAKSISTSTSPSTPFG